MANRKPIEKHDDNKWVHGFNRYSVIRDIVNSNSFDELKTSLSKPDGSGYYYDYDLLFQEFKFSNLVLDLEQDLCECIYKLFEQNKITNIDSVQDLIIENVRKYRDKTKEESKAIVINEITDEKQETSQKRLLTPHIIFYVAGMGLGDLIQLYRNYTIDFDNKINLIEKVSELNQLRNDFIHNLLSSRIDINSSIKRGSEIGQEIKNLLEPIINFNKPLF